MYFNPIKIKLFKIAKGIQELHQRKIIHRDIKPENIVATVDQRGSKYHNSIIKKIS